MRPLLAALLVAACHRAPPTSGATPDPTPDANPTPAPPIEQGPGAAFVYRGWPGEGIPDITAGRATTIELRDQPGGVTAGSCALALGDPVPYTASVVLTDRAAPVQLTEPHVLPEGSVAFGGLDVLDPAAAQGTSAAGRSIPPGARIAHLQYRAEGACFYRVEDDLVETTCFHDPSSSAVTSWWVETTCAGRTGWVRVDDRDDLSIARRF